MNAYILYSLQNDILECFVMLTPRRIEEIPYHYVRITLEDEIERYININFDFLLKTIGSHFPVSGKDDIGSAYIRIQEETHKVIKEAKDKWMEENKGKRNKTKVIHFPYNLHVSKQEIKSIRFAKEWLIGKDKFYIRIPYKVSYIFIAIINLVDKMKQLNFSIPDELKRCVNNTYAVSFYNKYIDEFRKKYNGDYKKHSNQEAMGYPAELYESDFDATNNVFQRVFWN